MTRGTILTIRSAPHLDSGASVDKIMRQVLVALLPVTMFAVHTFGLAALLVVVTASLSCVVTEHLVCRATGRATTIGDGSAAVTGVLYGLTLPPGLPLWMVSIGGVLAVGIGKAIFGGLGYNPFNPALVGRALLQAAFPVAMTRWPNMPAHRYTELPMSTLAWPFTRPHYDALSGATPLADWKFQGIVTDTGDLFLGNVSGSAGETSAALILLSGSYLIFRRVMGWQIPASILVTVAACSLVLRWIDSDRYAGPVFMLTSGGLMLGAVFMATDPVGSPVTSAGCLLYGVLIGVLVVVIRVWGGLPEGVMYAILLGNAITPHIDNWIQPRAYGAGVESPHD